MKKAKQAETANVENEESAGKKKSKKNPFLLLIVLVVVAAVAVAAVLFVLPRFGIQLLGGGDNSSDIEEPLPKKGIEVYTVGEDSAPALDTVLEEGDGELLARRSPSKKKGDESSSMNDRYTYIYELNSFADVMNRYLDVLMDSENGFYITDETYLVQEERPELQDAEGALILARNATVAEGEDPQIFQLVIGWSQASANLAVRVSDTPGQISFPKKEKEEQTQQEPSSVSMQMEQLRGMEPAHLGLSGNSMEDYTIFPVDGFVKVNEQDCRRFNIYEKDNPGSIVGTYFFSVDQQHIYVLNPSDNTVSTIK